MGRSQAPTFPLVALRALKALIFLGLTHDFALAVCLTPYRGSYISPRAVGDLLRA